MHVVPYLSMIWSRNDAQELHNPPHSYQFDGLFVIEPRRMHDNAIPVCSDHWIFANISL